jgi:hypothetical protein
MKLAVKYAKMLEKKYKETVTPSSRNPSTEVYKLIEDLMIYLKE